MKVERKGRGEDKCHSSHLDWVAGWGNLGMVGEDLGMRGQVDSSPS